MTYDFEIFELTPNTGSGSRDWTDDNIKFWMDKNDISYEDTDTREELIQRIKDAGYK